VDPAGYIYVADTGNHRIQKFDRAGRYIREIGGFGWEPGQFSSPIGLSAREGLNVYVADSQNRRIQRLDRDLNYLSSIPVSVEQEDLAFGFLWDIEVASTGELFVSDVENEQVWKLTSFGQLDRTFGGFGAAREQLQSPAALALGSGNAIYVADAGNGRIARYDTFGAFSGGLGQDHLRGPRGVDVGPGECLYVADTESDRLCVFGPRGELLFNLGGTGGGPGSFRSPMDVAISRDDEICVVDSGNDRVQMFAVLRQGERSQP
jgi:DNA-binding beta-propeller fold protein YncE